VGFFSNINERISRLTVIDVGMIKWSVFFATIIIVKLFPRLLDINYAVLLPLLIVCAARPLYKIWIRK